jgi:hypothetical protein
MKKIRIGLLFVIISSPALLMAQGDLDQLLKGSKTDAEVIAKGYINPFMKAFGYGLNQGWYNTAKTHKFPGADLTITVSPVYVPDTDKFFEVDNTKLANVQLTNTGTTSVPANGKGNVPTFFGSDKNPSYQLKPPLTGTFQGPAGIDFKYLPVPMAGLGIGLPKGFDLKFRFIPKIDLGNLSDGDVDGEFSLFGVGVMHDVKQYIPGIKSLPFDLSGFVGFTKMKLDVGFNTSFPDQRGIFESSATTIQGVISKKISVLTGYAGLGYNIAKTTLAVKGSYDFDQDVASTRETKDPFSLDAASSGPRMTAGLRLKLAVFAFHADYTLQKYNSLTVGFGINVR